MTISTLLKFSYYYKIVIDGFAPRASSGIIFLESELKGFFKIHSTCYFEKGILKFSRATMSGVRTDRSRTMDHETKTAESQKPFIMMNAVWSLVLIDLPYAFCALTDNRDAYRGGGKEI
jgi:hypothetical protein